MHVSHPGSFLVLPFLISQHAHGGGTGAKCKEQEKDKRARMFDQHLLTAGQHCGKIHITKTKPESAYDHIGQDLFADVLAHKHRHHSGESKVPAVHPQIQSE